jgi:hypothetical protein
MASLTLPVLDRAPALLPHAEIGYDELIRLASLAQALDPSLPKHVRYFQRSDSDLSDISTAPGRVVLTNDSRPELTDGLQDPNAVDLFDAFQSTLPPRVVDVLRERVQAATGAANPQTMVSKAFAAAHKAGRETLAQAPTSDPDKVLVFSPARQPAALAFTAEPFLTNIAAHHMSRARVPGEDIAYDHVTSITLVRQALAGDASRFSAPRLQEVVERIRSLDTVKGEAPFEERAQQGWVAYSLMAGGKGWARPLLQMGAGVVGPHSAYQGVNAITAAVAANDATAVNALLDAGALPNSIIAEVPRIFGARQAEVEAAGGQMMPLAVFGTAAGSTEAVAQLAKAGAMLDLTNNRGETPLSVAAAQQNEPAVRALLFAQANGFTPNEDGLLPSQRATGALRQLLEQHEAGVDAPAVSSPRGPRLG